ncbi:hypothetical protein K491DRAFT_681821 [Lophiostoma macrostomum CBS 122681]|uniref:Uncharacterized protein n=1 Tax=Lophiostoma macrostomum CBS 122681 TaxID=1314788 RepID=A0A6A6SVT8_9PLEO|nr:hypothetical protein K491DRAFT_681821 [Lophiostoma macrostomum CBS 122681]
MGFANLFHARATHADCLFKYPDAENLIPALPSFRTVGISLIIILLTIALEQWVSPSRDTTWEPASDSFRETSEVTSINSVENDFRRESVDVEANFAGNGNVATSKTVGGQHSQPAPKERANNFVVATIFVIPICIAFAHRIRDAQRVNPVEYDSFCRKEMSVSRTQWWAVFLFNIVPLVCACTAWLRTLVDCVLMRWNKSLTYEMWPPLWPISMTARMIPIFRDIVLWAMMRSNKTAVGRKDMDPETGSRTAMNEERRGLMPEGNNLDDDEVTVYDPRSSDEQLK